MTNQYMCYFQLWWLSTDKQFCKCLRGDCFWREPENKAARMWAVHSLTSSRYTYDVNGLPVCVCVFCYRTEAKMSTMAQDLAERTQQFQQLVVAITKFIEDSKVNKNRSMQQVVS